MKPPDVEAIGPRHASRVKPSRGFFPYSAPHRAISRGRFGEVRPSGRRKADDNWVENQIRPIAIGKLNWLFAGSVRAGKRAATVMRSAHSARLSGHDPYAYLKDVLERLPTQLANRVPDLQPYRWQQSTAS